MNHCGAITHLCTHTQFGHEDVTCDTFTASAERQQRGQHGQHLDLDDTDQEDMVQEDMVQDDMFWDACRAQTF